MTNTERRIEALELATGSPIDTEDLALQEMSDDDLEQRARAILANKDPPAEDDTSESAVLERKVRTLMARKDAERARQ